MVYGEISFSQLSDWRSDHSVKNSRSIQNGQLTVMKEDGGQPRFDTISFDQEISQAERWDQDKQGNLRVLLFSGLKQEVSTAPLHNTVPCLSRNIKSLD